MALPTNTFATYSSIGNREDLEDVIYNVDPTDTPFLTGCPKVRSTAVNHEWQTQDLAAAVSTNAVLEGNDAVVDATTATARLGNINQISDKVPSVTGTQQVINKAGRGNEMNYQLVLKGKELNRYPAQQVQNQAKDAGAATTARKLGGLCTWIATNDVLGSAGGPASSSGDGSDVRTDGTQEAFTESRLKTAIKNAFDEGGDPDVIMVGSFNKQVLSGFVGRGTPFEQTTSRKIIAAVDVYESDFGTMQVIPNRFQRARDVWILQKDMFAIAYLRNMTTTTLAKTGDNEKRQLLCEYTLESRNEKASAMVADCTTS